MAGRDLIADIYRSAGDKEHWQQVLARFNKLLESEMAFLFITDSKWNFDLSVLQGIDQSALAPYLQYYSALDTHIRNASKLPAGSVKAGFELNGGPEFFETEFFRDFYNRLDLKWCLGSALLNHDGCYAGIGLHRRGDDYDYTAVEKLKAVVPHLQQSLRLSIQFEGLEATRQELSFVLERLATGFILVDASGVVYYTNTAALRLLNCSDGLQISHKILGAEQHDDAEHLHSLIKKVADNSSGSAIDPGGTMRIRRSNGKPPLAVSVLPVFSSNFRLATGRAKVLIAVSDPASRTKLPPDHLKDLFGLTKAEAAAACALAAGLSISEYADSAHITEGTARLYVKRVFAKTGTTRQSELIALIARTPLAQLINY